MYTAKEQRNTIKNGIVAWARNDVLVLDKDGEMTVFLPLFPIRDHGISVSIVEKDGYYEMTDGGETGGALFVNGVEFGSSKAMLVEETCAYHGISFSIEAGQNGRIDLGVLKTTALDPREIISKLSAMFCAIIQIYAIFFHHE
jgi:hypothetical protein